MASGGNGDAIRVLYYEEALNIKVSQCDLNRTDLDAKVFRFLQKFLQFSFRFRKWHRPVSQEVQDCPEVLATPVWKEIGRLQR